MSSSGNSMPIYDIFNQKEGSLLKRLKHRLLETVAGHSVAQLAESAIRTVAAKAEVAQVSFETFANTCYYAYPSLEALEKARKVAGEPCSCGRSAVLIAFNRHHWTLGMALDEEGTGPMYPVRTRPLDTLAAVKFQLGLAGSGGFRVRLTWDDPLGRAATGATGFEQQYLWMDGLTQEGLICDLAAVGLIQGRPVQKGLGLSVALRPYWERVQAEVAAAAAGKDVEVEVRRKDLEVEEVAEEAAEQMPLIDLLVAEEEEESTSAPLITF